MVKVNKIAKIGQNLPNLANILRSLCQKVHQLGKNTPPAVVTNMSYGSAAKLSKIFVKNMELRLSFMYAVAMRFLSSCYAVAMLLLFCCNAVALLLLCCCYVITF